jgi:hypothetical protein
VVLVKQMNRWLTSTTPAALAEEASRLFLLLAQPPLFG